MKNNSKLTLVTLKKELEAIKNSNKISSIPTATKQSANTGKLLSLFSLTAILAYAHKVPVLNKVIKLL